MADAVFGVNDPIEADEVETSQDDGQEVDNTFDGGEQEPSGDEEDYSEGGELDYSEEQDDDSSDQQSVDLESMLQGADPDAILAMFGGDPKKLARSYAALNSKLGSQGRSLGEENAQLKAQLTQQQTLLQILPALMQQQGAGQQPQPQQQGMSEDDFAVMLAENPKKAVDEYVRSQIETNNNNMVMALQQLMAPMQQYVVRQQQAERVNQEVAQLQVKYPDYVNYKEDMLRLLDNPQYAGLPTQQNGMEWLYMIAKATAGPRAMQNGNGKRGLRPAGNNGRLPQQGDASPEDAIRRSIWGGSPNNKGIFGQS